MKEHNVNFYVSVKNVNVAVNTSYYMSNIFLRKYLLRGSFLAQVRREILVQSYIAM